MQLIQLVKELDIESVKGSLELEITGLSQNSKTVQPGYLFICIKGFVADGHHYIDQAIANGACAIIVQEGNPDKKGIPIIKVRDTRKVLAQIASRFYGYPSRQLRLIGITGTNGKTTVAYMIKAILEEARKKVGLLTTVENIINDQNMESKMTTMDALSLQKSFYKMLQGGTDFVVMEVSSHSLYLSRVDECDFDTAIFTNISDEHFEIHHNFQNYLKSKKELFRSLHLTSSHISHKQGIVNIDDKHAQDFLDCLKVKSVTYGIKQNCHFRAYNILLQLNKTSFCVETPAGHAKIEINMGGQYNVYNALAAIAATMGQGISLEVIAEAFQKFSGVPGRYKLLNFGQPYTIIIDFAHNFHGLENILKSLKLFSKNKIITVFGHGGERDPRVRKNMGQVVGNYSDYCIITTDNPRSEKPKIISEEIEKGLTEVQHQNYDIILSRSEAIEHALNIAQNDDIVLIAGKGPETKQVYKNQVIYHNDQEVVQKILLKKRF
mgnify:CR=1 FL=1